MSGRQRCRWILAFVLVAAVGVVLPVAGAVAGAGGGMATQEGPLALSASTSGAPGSSVNLSVTLRNEGDSRVYGPVVRVASLPENWSVSNATGGSGLYRASTREWLWTGIDPGGAVRANATVDLPGNASGAHTIRLVADDADGHNASTTVEIGPGGAGARESGGGLLLVVVILVVVLAVAGVAGGWWYWSRDGSGGT